MSGHETELREVRYCVCGTAEHRFDRALRLYTGRCTVHAEKLGFKSMLNTGAGDAVKATRPLRPPARRRTRSVGRSLRARTHTAFAQGS